MNDTMKRGLIGLLAAGAIGVGVVAPAVAQENDTADDTTTTGEATADDEAADRREGGGREHGPGSRDDRDCDREAEGSADPQA